MAVVRFFAGAKAAVGVSQEVIDGATVKEVMDLAQQKFPQLKAVLTKCSVLVNETSCQDYAQNVSDSDVIDVLPPFAGG